MPNPEDQNEHQPQSPDNEVAFLDTYEEDLMARVPFGGLEVMTESYHSNPNAKPKKER